jgi:hypothetical protein
MPLTLAFSASDWRFESVDGKILDENCSEYFALTWDYNNSSMDVNEIRLVKFSLTVSPSITDVSSFAFNLIITSIY